MNNEQPVKKDAPKMKKGWKKIIIAVFIILAGILLAANIFVNIKGKAILIKQIESLTHKKTTIGYFGITFPLHLEIRKLNIEGMAKADSIFITPSIPSLLMGKVILNSLILVRPEVVYNKVPPAQGASAGEQVSLPLPVPETGKLIPFAFGLKRLKIKDGKVDFIDHAISADGITITLKDINARFTNIYFYKHPANIDFSFDANIPWSKGQQEGKVDLHGWIDLGKKGMEASLKISDIDGVYLYPYYSTFVDLDKARIEKAKLNFKSDIRGKDNNVTAECHLELADIVRRPLAEGEDQEKAARITDAVLDMFKAMNQGKIVLDFTIKTKMDRPQFGFGNIKAALETKINSARETSLTGRAQRILAFPVKLIRDTLKTMTDLSRSVVDGTIAVGSQIAKVFEDDSGKGRAQ